MTLPAVAVSGLIDSHDAAERAVLRAPSFAADRRAFTQNLLERANASTLRVDLDAEFMLLAELWIQGQIDMAEMRERYGYVRRDRMRARRSARKSLPNTPLQEPFPTEDKLLAEIARLSELSGP